MPRICPLIQDYKIGVWHYLSRVFGYRLKASELGFSNDLVFRIVDFYRGRPALCEVYAFNDNVREATRGADIDLFIESDRPGWYHFYKLQAKMMNHQGSYKKIEAWEPHSQMEILISSARKERAKALCLLYNGHTPNSIMGATEWGLSIVKATEVKQLRLAHSRAGINTSVKFNDLYPLGMQPFHVLFCNIPDYYKLEHLTDGRNIHKGHPYVRKYGLGGTNQPPEEINVTDGNQRLSARTENEKLLAPYRGVINREYDVSI